MKILSLPLLVLSLIGVSPVFTGLITGILSLISVYDNSQIWLLLIWPGLSLLYLMFVIYFVHKPDFKKLDVLSQREKIAFKDHFFYFSYPTTAIKASQSIDIIRIIFTVLAIIYLLQGFYVGALIGLSWFILSPIQPKLNPQVYYVNAAKKGGKKAITRVNDLISTQNKLGLA